MSNTIDLYEFPRVEIGWEFAKELLEYLGRLNSPITFLYLSDSHELIITDPSIITTLKNLNLPYRETLPKNSLRFILNS